MRAFEGVTVLDFTQVLAGPFAVMQLALLGADVIKVEHPDSGDQTRGLMNAGEDVGMSPSFMGMNLNKRSLTLDLKQEEAVNIILDLLPGVDVIVENFKAGTMDRMGLGYAALRKKKPSLIYCALTGYGQTGPRAGEAAYDGAIQAASGMMSQTGHETTGPTRTGYMPVDMSTALNTAFAVSAALYRREKTGEGQLVDVAMLDTAVIMQASQFSNYLNQGTLVGLRGNASPTGQPTANVFPTSDGYIQITALRQPQVEKLFDELDLSDLLSNPDYATPDARLTHQQPVFDAMATKLVAKTTDKWMAQLAPAGIPVAEVKSVPDVAADPELFKRNALTTLPSPIEGQTEITVAKAGYVTDRDGPEVTSGPPLLGQHTDEILQSIGYDEQRISALRERGTI